MTAEHSDPLYLAGIKTAPPRDLASLYCLALDILTFKKLDYVLMIQCKCGRIGADNGYLDNKPIFAKQIDVNWLTYLCHILGLYYD